jgi:hypothetical protein
MEELTMKSKVFVRVIFVILILICGVYAQQDDSPVLKGPYLGQKPPGQIPEVFAPGII